MERREIILIIAGNQDQYRYWIRENIRYINDPKDLLVRNLNNCEIVRTGTFYERKDINEIESIIEAMKGEK